MSATRSLRQDDPRGSVKHRPGPLAVAAMVASIAASLGLSVALLSLNARRESGGVEPIALVLVFNATALLFSLVGAVIAWRRPGHAIGLLMLLCGPLFALLGLIWTAGGELTPGADRGTAGVIQWAGLLLSYPGMALIVGWLPLLFPTGTLPSPRWRAPSLAIIGITSTSLAALALRPGPLFEGGGGNPFGLVGWPAALAPLADSLLLQLIAVIAFGALGLVTRYRRGTVVERLQIRWLLAAMGFVIVAFVGTAIESALRVDDGILITAVLAYFGVLALPLAIGAAILRYRLFDIDRIISRTIAWTIVSGALVGSFIILVVGLSNLLGSITGGDTLAVAGSTLVVAALFAPLRSRVQRVVDRRFDRARYDGERVAAAFGERLRSQLDLADLEGDFKNTVGAAMSPAAAGVWLRSRNDFRTKEA
ncbi:MAG TPA: hypothetical protein VFR14_08340 [Candidatus Limnocylindrales bacterium]|nr:hypothetical protein [Candidatus Limnocylindrales bacterium]